MRDRCSGGRPARPISAAIAAAFLIVMATAGVAPAAPTTERVAPTGIEPVPGCCAPNKNAFGEISAEGQYVAFRSQLLYTLPLDDLGTDDDVFVYDRMTGQTERVSVRSDGSEVNDAVVYPLGISALGRRVLFVSRGQFDDADTGNDWDVFVHDGTTGETELASARSDGSEINDNPVDTVTGSISDNGQVVVFRSDRRYVPGDQQSDNDIFARDLETGQTTRISLRSDESEVNGSELRNPAGLVGFPRVSRNGNLVTFYSAARFTRGTGLTQNGHPLGNIFVRNRTAGWTARASLRPDGEPFLANVGGGDISANGRFVALAARGTIFLRDRDRGRTVKVTDGYSASISGNGRLVEYADFLGGGNGGGPNTLYRDRRAGQSAYANVDYTGENPTPSADSLGPAANVSSNGKWIVMTTNARLAADDPDFADDVYVRGPLF